MSDRSSSSEGCYPVLVIIAVAVFCAALILVLVDDTDSEEICIRDKAGDAHCGELIGD